MRTLAVLLSLSLSTFAQAADPECVAGVHAQVEQELHESPSQEASLVFDAVYESDAVEEACEMDVFDPSVYDGFEDGPRFPADQVVCDALATSLHNKLRLMTHLIRMVGECQASPTCDDATAMDMMQDAVYVLREAVVLIKEMERQGC